MVWGDIMTSFWPMCVITSAIARFIPIFKLEYFWNAKTYTGEILIWCHIDGVLSEKHQNTHNLNCLFVNGCLGWKFKNCWNDWRVIWLGDTKVKNHIFINIPLFFAHVIFYVYLGEKTTLSHKYTMLQLHVVTVSANLWFSGKSIQSKFPWCPCKVYGFPAIVHMREKWLIVAFRYSSPLALFYSQSQKCDPTYTDEMWKMNFNYHTFWIMWHQGQNVKSQFLKNPPHAFNHKDFMLINIYFHKSCVYCETDWRTGHIHRTRHAEKRRQSDRLISLPSKYI